MIPQPIFLVGAERSGTTLLRLMLKHHPQIGWVQEFEYAVDLVNDNGQYPNIERYCEWLEMHRIFQSMNLNIDRQLTYPQLINSFLEQKKTESNKPIIGATVHRYFNRLLTIWSDARFIHIIRDPRDVARSCIGMGWAGNVWYGIDRWIEAELLWERMKKELPSDRYVEISYENLIREPEANLTAICEFMNIDYDPAMLTYDQNSTYSSPNPKLVEQWRKKLSDEEKQLVETKIGNLLTQRGYQPSGLSKIELDELMRQKLRLQNWWYKVTFRVNRFGLSLFVQDYLSRKLGLKSWEKQNKLAINEIQKKYLK